MYLSFFGLRERPFNPTPDPRFLFLSDTHREALAQLEYGVRERRGFLVLTGEVGTGKTTLLQTLRSRLDPATEVAYVFNSKLSFEELLEYILEDFSVPARGLSHVQRLVALNRFLIERRRKDLNTVLIIDEAQNLDPLALEQIRLLSNFETPTDKLLQILLVGQPELHAKLLLPELRQLRQRIGLRCRIGALSAGDTAAYIRHRLQLAQGPFRGEAETDHEGIGPFTARAVRRIAGYSAGNPRVVNTVCEHCLLVAYADQKRRIDADTVEEAIHYLEEGEKPRQTVPSHRSGPAVRWGVGGAVAAALILAIALSGSGRDALSSAFSSVTVLLSDLVHHVAK